MYVSQNSWENGRPPPNSCAAHPAHRCGQRRRYGAARPRSESPHYIFAWWHTETSGPSDNAPGAGPRPPESSCPGSSILLSRPGPATPQAIAQAAPLPAGGMAAFLLPRPAPGQQVVLAATPGINFTSTYFMLRPMFPPRFRHVVNQLARALRRKARMLRRPGRVQEPQRRHVIHADPSPKTRAQRSVAGPSSITRRAVHRLQSRQRDGQATFRSAGRTAGDPGDGGRRIPAQPVGCPPAPSNRVSSSRYSSKL